MTPFSVVYVVNFKGPRGLKIKSPDFAPNLFPALRTLAGTGRDGFPRSINQKIIACA